MSMVGVREKKIEEVIAAAKEKTWLPLSMS